MKQFPGALNADGELARAIALETIASKAMDLKDAGGDDLTVNTFIQGAERELARKLPDTQKMGEAAAASKKYQILATGQ